MNISSLKTGLVRGLARTKFNTIKYSPEVLTTVGVVGIVTAGVLAARATLRLEETLDRAQARLDLTSDDTPSKAKTITTNAVELGKLYGPSLTLGLTSAFCIFAAHGILRKRNAALVVAYKGLEEAFTLYRGRVAEEIGEERERDLYLGLEEKEITNPETGKKEKVKVLTDPSAVSQYARFFDENNANWSRVDHERNHFWLKIQNDLANHVLQTHGFIFLNEVYELLGFDKTSAGSVVGWVLDEDGDGFVDIGLYDARNADFLNGHEKGILLDFNVDGVIYKKIDFINTEKNRPTVKRK
jgi:hypothetical protein